MLLEIYKFYRNKLLEELVCDAIRKGNILDLALMIIYISTEKKKCRIHTTQDNKIQKQPNLNLTMKNTRK